MKFDFENFKQSLLDNETITTDEMELTIKLVSEFIEKSKLKTFEVFRNGTQQGFVQAKNLKEAKSEVFATYGRELEVYEVVNSVFLVTDKSGRSAKPYKLTKEHIESNWDLDEIDNDSEETLYDYLQDTEIGCEWETTEIKMARIK